MILSLRNGILLCVLLPLSNTFAQPPQIPGYEIAWYDEFEGSSVDTSKWNIINTNQTTNNSLQDYLPGQVYLSSGNLVIKSENSPSRGLPYRSGQVISHAEQQYGRWEVRAKLPGTKGMWPAIWLLPNVSQYNWPSQGEIDIMENRGDHPWSTSSAFHWGTNPPYFHTYVYSEQSTYSDGPVNYHDDFHVYAVEWDPDQIRFFVDGVNFYTVSSYDVDGFFNTQTAPMQLVINTAIGGNFLDNPDATTVWPQFFEIDYVYVWKRTETEPWQRVENAGFESAYLSEWTTFGNTITNVRTESQIAKNSSGSLKVFGQFNGVTNYSGVEQALTVKPGMEIRASCDRYVASGDSIAGTSNICLMKVDYYRKRNGIFGTSDYIASASTTIANGVTTNDTWNHYEFTDLAPADAVEARLAIVFVQPENESGSVIVDNLNLKRVLPTHSLRIATYDLQGKPVTTQDHADLQSILCAIGNQRTQGIANKLDLLAFQSGPLSPSAYQDMVTDFESMYGFDYEFVYATASESRRNGFVYNADQLNLIASKSIDGLGFTRSPMLATFQPVAGKAEDVFSVLSLHLPMGDSNELRDQRAIEAALVENIKNSLPANQPFMLLGATHLSGSDENAWNAFADAGLNETINLPLGVRSAIWSNSVAFHPFHTEDASGAAGGMDDRHDLMLVSSEFFDRCGIEFNPGSMVTLANNGTHAIDGNLATGTGNLPIQNNLIAISDHLPVFADFDWGVFRSNPELILRRSALNNYTVRSSGPRPVSEVFSIRGSNSAGLASFGVVDFDFAGLLGPMQTPSRIESIRLCLQQNNDLGPLDGVIGVYLTTAAASEVSIDSAIRYQSRKDGIDSVPVSIAAGAIQLTRYPAIHRSPISGSPLANGTQDEIVLHGDDLKTVLLNSLSNGGKVRLLIVPEHPDTLSTFATTASSVLVGPQLNALYDIHGSRPESAKVPGAQRPRVNRR